MRSHLGIQLHWHQSPGFPYRSSLFPLSLPSLSYPTFPLSPIPHWYPWIEMFKSHKSYSERKSTDFRPHVHTSSIVSNSLAFSYISTNRIICPFSFVPFLNLWKHFLSTAIAEGVISLWKNSEIPQLNKYSKNNVILMNNMKQDFPFIFYYFTTSYGRSMS